MLSASSPLLVLLFTVLQLVLSVHAKGGSKGSKGSKKSSKKKNKSKVKHVYKEDEKCYNEKHVEIECPPETNTTLIVGIIAGVVAIILIIAIAVWLFKRRSQKKKKKSLNLKSRGIDDASSDREFIVPLVREDTKESDSLYSYKDKSMHV